MLSGWGGELIASHARRIGGDQLVVTVEGAKLCLLLVDLDAINLALGVLAGERPP
jgi:hypothetical protein